MSRTQGGDELQGQQYELARKIFRKKKLKFVFNIRMLQNNLKFVPKESK
jgi:hypothetical protein